jgi:hypothetical protein
VEAADALADGAEKRSAIVDREVLPHVAVTVYYVLFRCRFGFDLSRGARKRAGNSFNGIRRMRGRGR